MNGYIDVLHLLLKNSNIDLNIQDFNNLTPLHYAIANYRKDVVHLLLQHGAICDKELRDKYTPLYFAASFGFTDIVQELLIFGKADVNVYVYNELFQFWTPLDIAIENKHEQVQQLLLAHRAVEFRPISVLIPQFVQAVTVGDKDKLTSLMNSKNKKLMKQILATVKNGFSMSFAFGASSDSIKIINKNKIKVEGAFYAPSFPDIDKKTVDERKLYFIFEKINGNWLITDTDFSKKLQH